MCAVGDRGACVQFTRFYNVAIPELKTRRRQNLISLSGSTCTVVHTILPAPRGRGSHYVHMFCFYPRRGVYSLGEPYSFSAFRGIWIHTLSPPPDILNSVIDLKG